MNKVVYGVGVLVLVLVLLGGGYYFMRAKPANAPSATQAPTVTNEATQL
jgi:hypothetical protein